MCIESRSVETSGQREWMTQVIAALGGVDFLNDFFIFFSYGPFWPSNSEVKPVVLLNAGTLRTPKSICCREGPP